MAVASATECGLTIESENNACMIMALMPSAATKAIIQKIIGSPDKVRGGA